MLSSRERQEGLIAYCSRSDDAIVIPKLDCPRRYPERTTKVRRDDHKLRHLILIALFYCDGSRNDTGDGWVREQRYYTCSRSGDSIHVTIMVEIGPGNHVGPD